MAFETPESIQIPVRWGFDPRTRAEGKLVLDRASGKWSVETPCEVLGGTRLYLDLDLEGWGVPTGTRAIVRARSSRPGEGSSYTHSVEFEFSSMDVRDLVSRVVVPLPEPDTDERDSDDGVLTMDDEEVSELDAAARRIFETIPPEARIQRKKSSLESSLRPAPKSLPSQWRRALRYSLIAAAVVVVLFLIAYLVTWPRIR